MYARSEPSIHELVQFLEDLVRLTPKLRKKILKVCTEEERQVIEEFRASGALIQPPMVSLIVLEYRREFLRDTYPGASDEFIESLRDDFGKFIDCFARMTMH